MSRRLLNPVLASCIVLPCASGLAAAEPAPGSEVRAERFNLETAALGEYSSTLPSQPMPLAFSSSLNEEALGLIDVYIQINSIGSGASATGRNAIALGEGARASGAGAIAFGVRTQAHFDNSVAIGSGAITQRQNQIMLGSRPSTYAMPGVTSPGSGATQDGPLELVTTDSAGNIASDGGETVANLNQAIATNSRQVAAHTFDIKELNQLSETQAGAIEENALTLAGHQTQIGRLETRSSAHAQSIRINQSSIEENAQTIAGVEKQVDANATDIDLLKAGYAGESERFTTLETTVEKQGESMLAVEASMAQFDMALSNQSLAIGGLQTGMASLQIEVDQLALRQHQQHAEIEENTAGIAVANALAGSTWLQSNERIAFSMNLGHFDGSTALAFSGAARMNELWSANVAIGSVPERGDIGARAGLRVGW